MSDTCTDTHTHHCVDCDDAAWQRGYAAAERKRTKRRALLFVLVVYVFLLCMIVEAAKENDAA